MPTHAFHLVKDGNTEADYEDAFALDLARRRFAVADGASEASFAAAWAKLLCEGFVAAAGKPWRQLDWIDPLRERWATEVDGLPLPWYAEAKRDQGGFATLLGLALGRRRKWRVLAVGDSCLFHTRAGYLLFSFPQTRSTDFSRTPPLLGSRPSDYPVKYESGGGRWRQGDRFLLMTDALAQWFLSRIEQCQKPLADVAALLAQTDPQAAFPGWIDERRREQGLHNDDVTLLVIDPVSH
jgi:hypothetical protein